MSGLDTLTTVPDEQTVQQYVEIVQNVDLRTGLTAAAMLVAGILAVHLALKAADRLLARSGVPKTLHSMIRTMTRIVLYLVVVLTVANYIGIPVTSFVALLGLAGLAVSLALQGVLGNLAGGFIILLSHPFEVGNFVEYDGITGTVREIRMMHTRLETPDGKMVYVPNSSLSGARVINYSETGTRRVEISVSAAYGNSPAQVREAVLDAVTRTKGALQDPAPLVVVDHYGESDIAYTILVWAKNEDFILVKWGLTEDLYRSFAEHGVEFSYPHMNVHMK